MIIIVLVDVVNVLILNVIGGRSINGIKVAVMSI